jgi:hypothetical protein
VELDNLAVGESFTILDNTSNMLTTGLFTNAVGPLYTDSSGTTFLINYAADADADAQNNDVTLTVESVAAAPEPSTWMLLLAGIACVAAWNVCRTNPLRKSVLAK